MIKSIFASPQITTKYQTKVIQKNIPVGAVGGKLNSDIFVRSALPKQSPLASASIYPSLSVSFKSLSNVDDVLNSLNSQLMDVSEADVLSIVDEYPKKDRNLVLKILQRSTQFGNMESLNGLYDFLIAKKEDGLGVFSFSTHRVNSLIENLSYLHTKKAFEKDPATYIDLDTIYYRKKGAFLLDKNILSRIENDSNLQRHIKRNNFKLYYPEGWDSGVTVFNVNTLDEMKCKTNNIYKKVKANMAQGFSQDEAISNALNYDVKNKLKSLGLEDKIEVIQNNKVDFSVEPNASDIAKNLESRKMTKEAFEKALPQGDYKRGPALDILEKDGKVVSMRELGLIAKKVHGEIMDLAEQKGISEENIYYIIPRINKSYGVIALQYQQINNIDESKFERTYDQVVRADENSLYVILDDYAGSGDSLKDAYYDLRRNCGANIAIVPYIATKMGLKFIKSVLDDDDKASVINGKVLESYFYSKEYASINMKYPYFDLIGKGGWGQSQANIAFPYMSPDNNTSFFADSIASNYTFNSAGVKASDGGDSSTYELD